MTKSENKSSVPADSNGDKSEKGTFNSSPKTTTKTCTDTVHKTVVVVHDDVEDISKEPLTTEPTTQEQEEHDTIASKDQDADGDYLTDSAMLQNDHDREKDGMKMLIEMEDREGESVEWDDDEEKVAVETTGEEIQHIRLERAEGADSSPRDANGSNYNEGGLDEDAREVGALSSSDTTRPPLSPSLAARTAATVATGTADTDVDTSVLLAKTSSAASGMSMGDTDDDEFWGSFDECDAGAAGVAASSSSVAASTISTATAGLGMGGRAIITPGTTPTRSKRSSSAAAATPSPGRVTIQIRESDEGSSTGVRDNEGGKMRIVYPRGPSFSEHEIVAGNGVADGNSLDKWRPFGDDGGEGMVDMTMAASQQQDVGGNSGNENGDGPSGFSLDLDGDMFRSFEGDSATSSLSPSRHQHQHHHMTTTEWELCQRLDDEYERALEDREVAWKARYTSVRQSAFFSALFMILYLIFGCWFYAHHTTWQSVSDSLLFTVYTITTVGYGSHDIPDTASFRIFTIFYILVGIAAITVLAAHMYQFIVLEATRVQFATDRAELSRRGQQHLAAGTVNGVGRRGGGGARGSQGDVDDDDIMMNGGCDGASAVSGGSNSARARFMMELSAAVRDRPFLERLVDRCVRLHEETRKFLQTTPAGRVISVFLPFIGLILFGATVVGSLEGWSVVGSVYWAVVSLTTVGFGDLYPTRRSSIWFCILYLPCSLFFMSFFLANVAKSYIRLHAVHVARLERRMRESRKRAREREDLARRQAAKEVAAAAEAATTPRASGGQAINGTTNTGNDKIDGDGCDNNDGVILPLGGAHRGGFGRSFRAAATMSRGGISPPEAGFDTLPTGEVDSTGDHKKSAQLFGSPEAAVLNDDSGSSRGMKHRENVLHNSMVHYHSVSRTSPTSNTEANVGDDVGYARNNIRSMKKRRSRRDHMNSMKSVLKSLRATSRKMGKGSGKKKTISPHYQSVDYDATFDNVGEKGLVLETKSQRREREKRERREHKNQQKEEQQQSAVAQNEAAPALPPSTNITTPGPLGSPMLAGATITKPSFATRIMVQERLAKIIATDVAGYQSDIVIRECTLSVTIESLKDVADKWMIPRRARKAFRSVSFQCLFFVGEHDLITMGADALFRLNPFEFHKLFSPLLAAFGDSDAMEGWLAGTEVLADVELKRAADDEDDGDEEEDEMDYAGGGEGGSDGFYYGTNGGLVNSTARSGRNKRAVLC